MFRFYYNGQYICMPSRVRYLFLAPFFFEIEPDMFFSLHLFEGAAHICDSGGGCDRDFLEGVFWFWFVFREIFDIFRRVVCFLFLCFTSGCFFFWAFHKGLATLRASL